MKSLKRRGASGSGSTTRTGKTGRSPKHRGGIIGNRFQGRGFKSGKKKENSTMSNLIDPDFITLQVRDLAASLWFYGEMLGLKASPEVRPNAVAFATKPIGFAIRESKLDLEAGTKPGYGVILWFRTKDAASLCTHLKEHKVPIAQDLADGPFGKMFTVRDPDGYEITVHDGG
jgi:catechol 2,3-dioxygenase-like lactoylglutathione lyase family enzyme